MKKFGSLLWGLVFIAVGIIVGLNSFKVTNIDLFFNGWWTLFIIVPCFHDVLQTPFVINNPFVLLWPFRFLDKVFFGFFF